MKVVQISIEVNSGSVGRIAEQIGEQILLNGWQSYITYARNNLPSSSKTIKIGSKYDVYFHVLGTRVFDNHALMSDSATIKLCDEIRQINPDIIHLHHLHGYFVNFKILFSFLQELNKPVVWTFHDCWSFTGHCAHYDYVGCDKWKTECNNCPQKMEYPKSIFLDRSRQNFIDKKTCFNSLENLTIVPVSYWMEAEVKKSFLKENDIFTIQNGIDTDVFKPTTSRVKIEKKYNITEKKIILGVASTWGKRKGLEYFIQLSKNLPESDYKIVLVGLTKKQIDSLPPNIIGILRTESVHDLAELYSAADVFVNPTLEEALGLTNLEALSCGTPTITFASGGSPETINDNTGIVVERGNLEKLQEAIVVIMAKDKSVYSSYCRDRVVQNFDKNKQNGRYIELYKKVIKKQH